MTSHILWKNIGKIKAMFQTTNQLVVYVVDIQ
jgi:hypothetical protein